MGKLKYTKFTPAKPKLTAEMAEKIQEQIQEDVDAVKATGDAIQDTIQEAERVLRNSWDYLGLHILPVEAPAPQEKRKQDTLNPGEKQMFANLDELKELCEKYGFYTVLPTEELLKRGEAFYNEHWDAINAELEPLLPEDVRAVISEDYARVLAGIYHPTATVPQMERILKAVSPEFSFRLERYGFHVSLLLGYSRILSLRREYIQTFRTPITVERTPDMTDAQYYAEENVAISYQATRKEAFMSSNMSAMDAQAFTYLVNRGEVSPSDFVGIEIEKSIKFLDNVNALSIMGNYMSFYVVAKECLHATEDELSAITPPPLLGSVLGSLSVAEQALQELNARLGEVEKYVTAVYKITNTEKRKQALKEIKNARTPEDREQAIQNALRIAQEEQDAEPTLFTPEEQGEPAAPVEAPTNQVGLQVDNLTANVETADIVRLPENFGLILSRDIYASKDGKNANDILPISAFIEDYVTRKGLDKYISPYVVSKAVEGVNLLQRIERVRPVSGLYTYQFNISQFAELVGYEDANDEKKKELLTALMVLSDLYLIVWQQDGRHAIKVMSVRSIGLDGQAKGNIVLDVTAEAMAGRPNLITWNELRTIRENSKGQAELHFRYQIFSKGHIAEDDMLTQVFGYDTMLLEARGYNPYEETEQVKNVKNYIRKHKGDDKKKLRKMFDKYVKLGVIAPYEYKANKKGDYIYKWKRLKTIDEAPILPETREIQGGSHLDVQIPDEQ